MISEDYRALMADAARAHAIDPTAVIQPSSNYITLNGIRHHYLDWGNPHLPHVVFLHGAGLTAHSWDMAALLLRDHYHLIALDFRGHGDSDWAPDRAETGDTFMAQDLAAFMDHLGYDRVSLVGMSRGGMIGVRYMAESCERIETLILVDISPEAGGGQGRSGPRKERPETEVFEHLAEIVERSLATNKRTPVDYLRYILYHSLRQLPDGRWTWKEDRRPDPRGRQASWAAPDSRVFLRDVLHGLRTPTLLIRGEFSRVLSDDDALRTVEMMHDIQYVVVPNAGHSVQTNNPKGFAQEVDAFLSERLESAVNAEGSTSISLKYDSTGASEDAPAIA